MRATTRPTRGARAAIAMTLLVVGATGDASGGTTGATSAQAGCSDTTEIVTRCEWGADETIMTWAPEFYATQKLTVHHTATSNGDVDPAATVRAIYRYQAVDLGFGDIGYQYLIDENGRVYEGRYSGDDSYPAHDPTGTKVVTAAHVEGSNSGNIGIALLGTLTSVDATIAARAALEQLLRELVTRHGISPQGASLYVNPVNGTTRDVANISGHRDWAATKCPGGTFYAQLPAIREAVAGAPPPTDTAAPLISGVTAIVNKSNVSVRWTTDEASTSRVQYRRPGVDTWTATALDNRLTIAHTVAIGGLARRTTYEYQVVSVDAAGNVATSTPVRTFTTA